MGLVAFEFGAAWVAILLLAYEIDRLAATERHVELTKQVFQDELKKLRAESLSMPGGFK